VASTTPRPLYPRQIPDTHCTGGWLDPGPVWTCAKNLAPTGIRSPDRPARSQSLYRLSYPLKEPMAGNDSYNHRLQIAVLCDIAVNSYRRCGEACYCHLSLVLRVLPTVLHQHSCQLPTPVTNTPYSCVTQLFIPNSITRQLPSRRKQLAPTNSVTFRVDTPTYPVRFVSSSAAM
jgi:hypothetical protein